MDVVDEFLLASLRGIGSRVNAVIAFLVLGPVVLCILFGSTFLLQIITIVLVYDWKRSEFDID